MQRRGAAYAEVDADLFPGHSQQVTRMILGSVRIAAAESVAAPSRLALNANTFTKFMSMQNLPPLERFRQIAQKNGAIFKIRVRLRNRLARHL